MGIFDFNLIKKLLTDDYKNVVETGTFQGDGVDELVKYFENIYTIEISDDLYNKAVSKFKNNKKIKCIKGDSAIVLIEIMDELNTKGKMVFWLDAHWSGDNSVDWNNSLWKGYNIDTSHRGDNKDSYSQVPLEEEIMNIYYNFNNECIIYIDDFDKINPQTGIGLKDKCFKGEDLTHIDFNKILNSIKPRILDFFYTYNQAVIKLSSK